MGVEGMSQLKASVVSGSAGTFADVFSAHQRAALRFAYLLTGDEGVAEDVVADAFAGMYGKWMRGTIDAPDAYLRRAIVNQVRGRFRRAAVRRKHGPSVGWRAEPMTVSAEEGVADRERLRRALGQLTARQRAIVVLRVVEDLSVTETARELGVSGGTVKAQLSRAFERLRAALDDGNEP
jgi:RNA polymerase sigma-70 factor (sigma-E family)